jgi:non-specific serine/threonine protein kinase/serine/threonine-protein kinase
MEWVDGPSLTEYLHGRKLDLSQSLKLFNKICLGVQHIHDRGLIHQDLKLANVLVANVDGEAQPKLIDFGLAISIAGVGSPLARGGTSGYMSPEQRDSSKRIDTRSDVFALGAILLRMVSANSGDLESLENTAQLLHRTKSPEQAQWLERIPFELRAIIAKAVSEDREARYPSAQALAIECERYLAVQPISAMPDRWLYRAAKFIRRNRVVVSLLGLVVTSLIIATSSAVIGYVRANDARRTAELESEKSRSVAEFVSNLLSGIDPAVSRGMDTRLLKLLVGDAERRLETDLAKQAEVRAEIHELLAKLNSNVGDEGKALEHAKAALKALAESAEETQERARRRLQLTVMAGGFAAETDQVSDGLELLSKARDELGERFGKHDRATLWAQSEWAWYRTFEETDVETSISVLAEVVRILESSSKARLDDLVTARWRLGILFTQTGKIAEAQAQYAKAERAWREVYDPAHPRMLNLRNSAYVTYLAARDFKTGAEKLKAVLPDAELNLGPEHPITVMLVSNLAGALRQSGALAESGPYYQRSYQSALKRFGPDHLRTLIVQGNYGNYLTEAGQPEHAKPLQEAAARGVCEKLGVADAACIESRRGLSDTLIALGDLDGAEKQLSAAELAFAELSGASPSLKNKLEDSRKRLQAAKIEQ